MRTLRCSKLQLTLLFFYTGAQGPGGQEFVDFQKNTEDEYGVEFYKALADLPPVPEGSKRLA